MRTIQDSKAIGEAPAREDVPFCRRLLHSICAGDTSCETTLLTAFSEGVPELLGQMVRAFADRDVGRFRTAAQAMKGECLTLGASPLVDLCGLMELAAERGDFATLAAGLDRACDLWRATRSEVKGYLDSLRSRCVGLPRSPC